MNVTLHSCLQHIPLQEVEYNSSPIETQVKPSHKFMLQNSQTILRNRNYTYMNNSSNLQAKSRASFRTSAMVI